MLALYKGMSPACCPILKDLQRLSKAPIQIQACSPRICSLWHRSQHHLLQVPKLWLWVCDLTVLGSACSCMLNSTMVSLAQPALYACLQNSCWDH